MAVHDTATDRPDNLTDELIRTDIWTDELVAASGIPSTTCPSSPSEADRLIRPHGFPPGVRHASGRHRRTDRARLPWQTYQYLTRLRKFPSGNGCVPIRPPCPTTCGVFPATRCARRAGQNVGLAVERPHRADLCDYWTPRAGTVFGACRPRPTASTTGRRSVKGRCEWRGGGPAAAISPSSPRRRAPGRPGGWPSAAGWCTWPSVTRTQVPPRPPGVPGGPAGRAAGGERLRAPRARLREACAGQPGVIVVSGVRGSSPPGSSSA